MFKFRIHLPTLYSLLILGIHILALNITSREKKINRDRIRTYVAQAKTQNHAPSHTPNTSIV